MYLLIRLESIGLQREAFSVLFFPQLDQSGVIVHSYFITVDNLSFKENEIHCVAFKSYGIISITILICNM